jgi:TonB family protein
MLEMNQRRTVMSSEARIQVQQPRKLMLALIILVVALIAVLVKDRDFWFGSEQATIESDMPASQPVSRNSKTATPPGTASAPARKQIPAAKTSVEQNAPEAPVAVNRTVLPPMDVEVIAGDAHKKLRPGSRITHVEIPNPSIQAEPTVAAPATNAADREPLPSNQPAQAYPLLAQHMNVQGSVVLQALIGPDGIIENLRVMSGPTILAVAAQQAVRQWRFKPILQHGQAVESKAQITVNFTIRVADNSAKTTLAESRISDTLIITR